MNKTTRIFIYVITFEKAIGNLMVIWDRFQCIKVKWTIIEDRPPLGLLRFTVWNDKWPKSGLLTGCYSST